MDIQMICMDLDGTALQADRRSFSPRLEAALLAAHEKGIAVVPVTGRQFGLLPPPVKGHPAWENLAVLINGAQIRELATGKLLYHLNIEHDALRPLLEVADRFGLPIEFSQDSILHLTQKSYDLQLPDPSLAFHIKDILANHGRIVESLEPLCSRDVEKVNLLCIPEERKTEVMAALAPIAVSAVWSSANSLEITHPDANKGRGLEEVCRLMNIPAEATLALGDSGNDITMLRRAGLGVAMGNAPEVVKEAADLVADHHLEDGAAKAIERYALKML